MHVFVFSFASFLLHKEDTRRGETQSIHETQQRRKTITYTGVVFAHGNCEFHDLFMYVQTQPWRHEKRTLFCSFGGV